VCPAPACRHLCGRDQYLYQRINCSAHCADDNSFCIGDGDCAAGTCSGTATICFSNTGCIAPATCVFRPSASAECAGDVVCAEPHITVDYCVGAINVAVLLRRIDLRPAEPRRVPYRPTRSGARPDRSIE